MYSDSLHCAMIQAKLKLILSSEGNVTDFCAFGKLIFIRSPDSLVFLIRD